MIKNCLTSERYLENYNKGEKTVVGILNTPRHICVTETDMSQETVFYNNEGIKIPRRTDHYLVGPIADALHAYEELGYSPEELKEIIEKYKELKRRVLYISTVTSSAYGTLGSPFEKKFREMREDWERRKALYAIIDTDHEIESLYPKTMLPTTAREVVEQTYERARYIAQFDEWVKRNLCAPAKTNPKHPIVEKAIFNDPATIVFWKDGTKTVVKTQKGEKYDPEKGLAMAFSKKMFGNEGNYYDQFTKLLPKKNGKK